MKDLKVGLVAQSHNTGIGTQSWELARHLKPEKVLVTDLTQVHGQAGKRVRSYPERFEGMNTLTSQGIPTNHHIDWLTNGVDVVFVVETPLNHELFNLARTKKVKTVLQTNWEFLDLAARSLPRPDMFLAPSQWEYSKLARLGKRLGVRVEYLPSPVATDRIKRRPITLAKTFVHIAGHQTYMDRNGTKVVEEAWALSQSKPNIVTHSQQGNQEKENYWELFEEGDVLLLPRRYGGLSLQLQEACAAGMLVIVGEHDPYANDMTVTARSKVGGTLRLRNPIKYYNVDPYDLAEKIDKLHTKDISRLAQQSYEYAESISWDNMKLKYQVLLEELASS